jgi:hypothetical protein
MILIAGTASMCAANFSTQAIGTCSRILDVFSQDRDCPQVGSPELRSEQTDSYPLQLPVNAQATMEQVAPPNLHVFVFDSFT